MAKILVETKDLESAQYIYTEDDTSSYLVSVEVSEARAELEEILAGEEANQEYINDLVTKLYGSPGKVVRLHRG